MASKVGSERVGKARPVATAANKHLQITPHKNGYLIKGDVPQSHAALKEFATWNEQLGAWYITRRRAYEYDHHYGLKLFGK